MVERGLKCVCARLISRKYAAKRGIYSGVSAIDDEHTPVSEDIPVVGWTDNPVCYNQMRATAAETGGVFRALVWKWRLDWPNKRAATLR